MKNGKITIPALHRPRPTRIHNSTVRKDRLIKSKSGSGLDPKGNGKNSPEPKRTVQKKKLGKCPLPEDSGVGFFILPFFKNQ